MHTRASGDCRWHRLLHRRGHVVKFGSLREFTMYSVVHEEIADGIVWCNLIVQMVEWGALPECRRYSVVHQHSGYGRSWCTRKCRFYRLVHQEMTDSILKCSRECR